MEQTKEQLQKKLNKIHLDEQRAMVEKHYPDFKKRFEGKYFKYRNCYSCPEKKSDYWYMYIKVTEIKPADVYSSGENKIW